MSKVRALYDFSADPGTTELTITIGDILTVIRRNVGEGWMEGQNQNGQKGLFPEAYVEELESEPPSMPPPPCPVYSEVPDADWGNINEWQSNQQDPEEWDDDWDDDSETGSTQPASSSVSTFHSVNRGDFPRQGAQGTAGKKSFNRFSSFVKSGGESFILGTVKLSHAIREDERVTIFTNGSIVEWAPITEPYSCVIASPKKESKMKGLKSYITYQLTPTFNNIQVSRRYKQFDWLHERLQEKFSIIPIPPLPEKQISGRYEENFIEHRKTQLQAFVNCVCRHPVLSRSAVWLHFITCTDGKEWKNGKRRAERDELLGAKWFLAIRAPEHELQGFLVEKETEDCARFIVTMDTAVRNLTAAAQEQSKRLAGTYRADCNKVGQSFLSLAQAFEMDKTPGNPREQLTRAVKTTGDIYNEVGQLMAEQPKHDWQPLGDVLHIYKGIISSFPDILTLHKNALMKRKECAPAASPADAAGVTQRTDTLSYALMAEINHFHQERANDFKMAMRSFLAEQIAFYQKIVDRLNVAYSAYEY